jgi:hypothetical protein
MRPSSARRGRTAIGIRPGFYADTVPQSARSAGDRLYCHRYRITPVGAQVAIFYARLFTRALRPACSLTLQGSAGAQRAFDRLDAALANFLQEVKLVA